MNRIRLTLAIALLPAAALAARADDAYADPFGDESVAVYDPLETINRGIYAFNDVLFTYALRPAKQGYVAAVPPPARRGIRNVLNNLAYPVRLVGNLLQGRLEGAAKETGGFLLNSTVGIGGLWDHASRLESLQTPGEDVGQAFGAWGIGPGPYLVLPVLGPRNPRDLVGDFAENFLSPVPYIEEWELRTSAQVTEAFDNLPLQVDAVDAINASAVDPYVAIRTAYSERRAFQVAQ